MFTHSSLPAGLRSHNPVGTSCVLIILFCYLLADGSDLDTVSHGSLDSANDSAERTSIDTDFTKMDSSDDGFSTGKKPEFASLVLNFITHLLIV